MKSEEKSESRNRGKSYEEIYGIEKAVELANELKAKAKAELDGFHQKYQERLLPLYGFLDYAMDRNFSVVDASAWWIGSRNLILYSFDELILSIENLNDYEPLKKYAILPAEITSAEAADMLVFYFSAIVNLNQGLIKKP